MCSLIKAFAIIVIFSSSVLYSQNCINCHKKVTPLAVTDWQLSKHSENDVSCDACHGDKHDSADNVHLVELPQIRH